MNFRKATVDDLEQIMAILDQARDDLRLAGVDQWQNGYPNEAIISADINNDNSYVLEKDNKIFGTVALEFDGDPNYNKIYEGAWLTEQAYAAIHRIAILREAKGQGLASQMIASIIKHSKARKVDSIRVDTHEDNKAMQRMLKKNGFEYCGVIFLVDGAKRVAFEKILS